METGINLSYQKMYRATNLYKQESNFLRQWVLETNRTESQQGEKFLQSHHRFRWVSCIKRSAQERTRTSTGVIPLEPESSASASSATWAA